MKFQKEPLFSFIVPVYDMPTEIFKRCLMSIDNQDYPNIEVVIVPNGGDKKAEATAREFSEGKPNWKVVPTEEKGACMARNLGFENSTGEIVSFFCSDYIANTGMVRMWVDKLLENPDCGFAYGAYEYNSKDRSVYWSKPFDRFELEVANFIDAGFPLWRKHVVKWDTDVKSLQDWDFWLRVSKDVKGFYLGREISFIAEPPRLGGLSLDSMENWVERVRFIRNKHNLQERDICVVSVGAPKHGLRIAKMIGADYRDDTIHKDHEYKALYLIGWYMKPDQAFNEHPMILKYFKDSVKIVHFVGADIYWLRKFPVQAIKEWSGAMRLSVDHFLSENKAAQEELRSYGIESEIVPIPPYTDLEVESLPDEFSVAVFLPGGSDFDKYLQRHTLSIIKAMPDIKFKGYGDANLENFKSSNFENRGLLSKEEWEKFVYENSAYLRLVRHDTRPMASDEFMIAGRSVITNIPCDFMDVIDTSGKNPFDSWDKFSPGFSTMRWPETKKKIIQKIREVKNRKQDMTKINAISLEYRRVLDKQIYINKINDLAKSKKIEPEAVLV